MGRPDALFSDSVILLTEPLFCRAEHTIRFLPTRLSNRCDCPTKRDLKETCRCKRTQKKYKCISDKPGMQVRLLDKASKPLRTDGCKKVMEDLSKKDEVTAVPRDEANHCCGRWGRLRKAEDCQNRKGYDCRAAPHFQARLCFFITSYEWSFQEQCILRTWKGHFFSSFSQDLKWNGKSPHLTEKNPNKCGKIKHK